MSFLMKSCSQHLNSKTLTFDASYLSSWSVIFSFFENDFLNAFFFELSLFLFSAFLTFLSVISISVPFIFVIFHVVPFIFVLSISALSLAASVIWVLCLSAIGVLFHAARATSALGRGGSIAIDFGSIASPGFIYYLDYRDYLWPPSWNPDGLADEYLSWRCRPSCDQHPGEYPFQYSLSWSSYPCSWTSASRLPSCVDPSCRALGASWRVFNGGAQWWGHRFLLNAYAGLLSPPQFAGSIQLKPSSWWFRAAAVCRSFSHSRSCWKFISDARLRRCGTAAPAPELCALDSTAMTISRTTPSRSCSSLNLTI